MKDTACKHVADGNPPVYVGKLSRRADVDLGSVQDVECRIQLCAFCVGSVWAEFELMAKNGAEYEMSRVNDLAEGLAQKRKSVLFIVELKPDPNDPAGLYGESASADSLHMNHALVLKVLIASTRASADRLQRDLDRLESGQPPAGFELEEVKLGGS